MSLIVKKPSKVDFESRENYGLIRYQIGKTFRAKDYDDKAEEVKRLKDIVGINDSNIRSVTFPSEQSDANEFVLPLFEALYQENPFLTVSKLIPKHNSERYIEKESCGEEQISITLALNEGKKKASELLENYNKIEELNESENTYFKEKTTNQTKKVKTNKQISTFVKDDVNEIVVSLKRFETHNSGDGFKIKKIDDKIEFDDLELPVVNLKKIHQKEDDKNFNYPDLGDTNKFLKARFTPTSFICHRGTFSAGHYVTFVKEKDNKWYCYNDSSRTCVDENDLQNNIKTAYIVKYSKVEKDGKVDLPERQIATTNPSNACWANATAVFAGSFVSFAHFKDAVLNKDEKKKYKEITGFDPDDKVHSQSIIQNSKKVSGNINLYTLPDFNYTEDELKAFGLKPKKFGSDNTNQLSNNLVKNKSTFSGVGLTTSLFGSNTTATTNTTTNSTATTNTTTNSTATTNTTTTNSTATTNTTTNSTATTNTTTNSTATTTNTTTTNSTATTNTTTNSTATTNTTTNSTATNNNGKNASGVGNGNQNQLSSNLVKNKSTFSGVGLTTSLFGSNTTTNTNTTTNSTATNNNGKNASGVGNGNQNKAIGLNSKQKNNDDSDFKNREMEVRKTTAKTQEKLQNPPLKPSPELLKRLRELGYNDYVKNYDENGNKISSQKSENVADVKNPKTEVKKATSATQEKPKMSIKPSPELIGKLRELGYDDYVKNYDENGNKISSQKSENVADVKNPKTEVKKATSATQEKPKMSITSPELIGKLRELRYDDYIKNYDKNGNKVR
ncbi:MAG: hypothetical protein FJ368_03845 [Pelagibacterales bacterium]|nr:hypothetical protein [Pelagibacterales bacterium]